MESTTEAPVPVEEYFRRDAVSEAKLEYWHGRIYAMAGEGRNHATIAHDVVRSLDRQKPDCLVLTSSLRVRAPGYGRANYAYPDGLLVCGEEQYDDATNPPTLLNPSLLIEVTSPSTRSHDQGDKFDAYFRIEHLQEYWLIDPDTPYVRRCQRHDDGILVHLIQSLDAVIESEALGLRVPMAEVYRRVTFPPKAEIADG